MPLPAMGSSTSSPGRRAAVAPRPQAVAWCKPLWGKQPFRARRCSSGTPRRARRGLRKTKTCIVGAAASCAHPNAPRTSRRASRTRCFTVSASISRARDPCDARRRQSTYHRQPPSGTPPKRVRTASMCRNAPGQSASRAHCCSSWQLLPWSKTGCSLCSSSRLRQRQTRSAAARHGTFCSSARSSASQKILCSCQRTSGPKPMASI
mmetsp:Transcript_45804/g.146236  ORF Transcript_45804/g.146236 Transcript_45804/m.146236 type:complete len:207 (-) Transcript_45804:97-717(-)